MRQEITEEPKVAGELRAALSDSDNRASLVLGVGSLLWKGLSYWEHTDFLLSIREERFNVMFDFFEHAGWLLLVLVSIGWFIWSAFIRDKYEPKRTISLPLVISWAIVSFMFGVLITVRATGGVPNVVTSYGVGQGACNAIIDTSRLLEFRNDFRIILLCGLVDPTVDMLDNKNVVVSNTFEITPGGIPIVATDVKSVTMANALKTGGSLWVMPALIPARVDANKISTLGDVPRVGGKIISPAYWQ